MTSRYRRSLESFSKSSSDSPDVVGIFWTPEDFKNELDRLDGEVESIDKSIYDAWYGPYERYVKAFIAASLEGISDPTERTRKARELFESGSIPHESSEDNPSYVLWNFYTNSWQPFYKEWNSFYKERTSGPLDGWTRRLWGMALWDEMKTRRNKMETLWATAREISDQTPGSVMTAPPPTGMPTTPGEELKKAGSSVMDWLSMPLKIFAGVAGVVLGLFVLSKLSSGSGRQQSLPSAPSESSEPETKAERQARKVAEKIKSKSR